MNTARVYCLLIVACVQLSQHAASAQDKRAPLGFVGMRGKKFVELDDPDIFKRKPQYHFIGVKGKKDLFDFDQEVKRAPMGFLGMRGKKDPDSYLLPHSSELYDDTGYFRGKINYSPIPMLEQDNPLRDYQLNELLERLRVSDENDSMPESVEDDMSNAINKRAAKMNQFYGVRGKKSGQPFEANFRGRFIAVRGKRDMKNSDAQEIREFLLGQNGPWPKRKAQMGFFGMRGKKWADESSFGEEQVN
uniref:Tachykinin n=1 Tax=Grapholita molesta TaxID=192188 RepID=A0A7D7KH58_GRAMO|nr:tachykinin [Grapholita molesta]